MDTSSGSSPLFEPSTFKIKNDLPARNENRTGLVFESSSNHFDRHNKLHVERPCRVHKVEEYLKQPNNSDDKICIADRCQILESRDRWPEDDGKGNSEQLRLDNYYYLRVHLPGYMQL